MTATPTAALLIIGNEILSGRTQDANLRFIAERMALRGITLREVRVVRDEEAAIIDAVRALSAQHTVVFTTGGIGPTHDDITAECMAKAFNTGFGIHAEAKRLMEEHYAKRGVVMNEGRLRMARIPEGAELIINPATVAPGFRIQNVYVMAGVPHIMQAMLLGIEPELPRGAPVLSNSISSNLREGDIAIEMEAIQNRHPAVEIGSYPIAHPDGSFSLSLVLRGSDENLLEIATGELSALLRRLGDDPVIARQRPPGA